MFFSCLSAFSNGKKAKVSVQLYRSLDEIDELDSVMKFGELKARAENCGLGSYIPKTAYTKREVITATLPKQKNAQSFYTVIF